MPARMAAAVCCGDGGGQGPACEAPGVLYDQWKETRGRNLDRREG